MRADRRGRAETGPQDPPGRSPAVRGAPLRASGPHAPTAAKWRPTAWQSTAQRLNPIARRRVCSRQSLERGGAASPNAAPGEPAAAPIVGTVKPQPAGSDWGQTQVAPARARATASTDQVRACLRMLLPERSEAYGRPPTRSRASRTMTVAPRLRDREPQRDRQARLRARRPSSRSAPRWTRSSPFTKHTEVT